MTDPAQTPPSSPAANKTLWIGLAVLAVIVIAAIALLTRKPASERAPVDTPSIAAATDGTATQQGAVPGYGEPNPVPTNAPENPNGVMTRTEVTPVQGATGGTDAVVQAPPASDNG